MKKQVEKRINVNLTAKELYALEAIEDELENRCTPAKTSDIIRNAILSYCKALTGLDYSNPKPSKMEEIPDILIF
nr:MAG TPA: hypothetical protein [Microviridae sp.]